MTRRLLLGYLSLAMLVLLCLEVPLGLLYGRGERERVLGSAEDEAESVAAYASLSLTSGRPERELHARAARCAGRIGGRVVVLGPRGEPLATSHRLSGDESRGLASRPEVEAALAGRAAGDLRASVIDGVEHLAVAAPVRQGARTLGAVRIAVPTDRLEARVDRVWTLLALVGVAVLTAVSFVGFAFARWTGRPIRELEEAAHRLAEGGLSARVAITSGPPEIRSLAATFNRTAARLEHLVASQRAFAGEASHQLKTPLAALRLRLDNLESEVTPNARGSLAAAVTETDRLARMVEGLLALARLDETAADREPVGLDRVCAERHRTWKPLFERHGVELVRTGDFAWQVLAVPGAVEQILDNLLSNALRVSPAGSTVRVGLRRPASSELRHLRHTHVELHVTDEGPGMTDDQRRRAFDRFWRAPGAPKGGTGLGLALVQRLAHACGGDADLRPAPGGGLDAVVHLPVAARSVPAAAPPSPRRGHRPALRA
ncbi:HAMP domain-containing sensor histidine kinase [Streptomyces sp. GC420]|uniref:sensor histidine kinase n=1 Tax=Streptomyces sp. GC420 TaxID=2697568 RepID=UPI001414FD3A|nr:HAMP domain-containing sensor histidine kinase [Streptomyces sp. GC420]NBM17092.1 HAMP domain-containing protein [Streptomyces sp. GC420]